MLSISFSPFPVIETERLLLRSVNLDDAPQLFFLRSDPGIMKYLDREPHQSVDETVAFIKEKILGSLHKNEGILWVITLKNDPEKIIGTTGFWRIDFEHYRTEIGYMLHSDYWKKGYMKEAVLASIKWIFSNTDIHSIEANINPGNEASEGLLKSVGFIQEAYFRENYYFNGVFKDSVIYSMIKPK